MPARRAKADRLLESALAALRDALDETRAPWMAIGGIAVIARGVRRLTTDIDAVVRGDAIELEVLVGTFARHAIDPRIDDAVDFARANLVLLLQHAPTGVSLDVSLGWSGFEHAALEARTEARFGGVVVPMATAEDLVILKVVAARAKDLEDAEALLVLHDTIDVERARRAVQELADLAEEPAIVAGFERIVRRTRKPSKGERDQSGS